MRTWGREVLSGLTEGVYYSREVVVVESVVGNALFAGCKGVEGRTDYMVVDMLGHTATCNLPGKEV